VQALGKELTEGELRALLSEETPVPDKSLSELTLLDAYAFSDGRILFLFDAEPPTGTLWPSRERVLQSLSEQIKPAEMHILEGLQPQGQSFPKHIDEFVSKLAELTTLSSEELDYSVESLDLLDSQIKERFEPEKRLGAQIFPCLVAYLGEVVRQSVDGIWEMRRASHADVWEPWVRSPDGREFAPFVCVHDQIVNHTDASARLVRAVPAWAK
jgi:hypothetical protein